MTSPFPPRKRDTRSLADRSRQDRQNLKNLAVGHVGGRFPLTRPLGAAAAVGDFEDDAPDDDTTEIAFWNADATAAAADGAVSLPLTFEPIEGSLHIRWQGLDLPPTAWSLTGQTVSFSSPYVRAGDALTAAYAYFTSDAPESGILVPFTTGGWAYKQVALADSTNYSAPGYDDDSWTRGATMFGNGVGAGVGAATAWAIDTSLWLRREVAARTGMTVTVPVEDGCVVYANGTEIGASGIGGTTSGHISPPFTVDVPDDLITDSTWLLAVRANDEAGGSSDQTSVDVQVSYDTGEV